MRVQIQSTVLKCLIDKPGQPVFLADLQLEVAKANGGKHAPLTSIQQCMNRLMQQHPIEVVQPGQAWSYVPNKQKPAQTGERLFREIGPIQDGSLILQADDQSLWKATRL